MSLGLVVCSAVAALKRINCICQGFFWFPWIVVITPWSQGPSRPLWWVKRMGLVSQTNLGCSSCSNSGSPGIFVGPFWIFGDSVCFSKKVVIVSFCGFTPSGWLFYPGNLFQLPQNDICALLISTQLFECTQMWLSGFWVDDWHRWQLCLCRRRIDRLYPLCRDTLA